MKLPFFRERFLERRRSYPKTLKRIVLMEDNFLGDNFSIHVKVLFLDELTNGRLEIHGINGGYRYMKGKVTIAIIDNMRFWFCVE